MSGTALRREQDGSEPSPTPEKPIIVGIYGISGCGKSYLSQQLKRELGEDGFAFYEGSDVISKLTDGLDEFKSMGKNEQDKYREQAITKIQEQCTDSRKVGIVVGHYMFWSEGETDAQVIWTESDGKAFTHIIYLDVEGSTVDRQRRGDEPRKRDEVSIEHLDNWRNKERDELRNVCREHRILFSSISPKLPNPVLLSKALPLVRDFQQHSEKTNMDHAEEALKTALSTGESELANFLVLDGDKTLTSVDTGNMFWDEVCNREGRWSKECTAKAIHKGPLKFSHEAFRQVALLYEEAVTDDGFDGLCKIVADQVELYPEFISLLERVRDCKHVGAIVITSGLRLVWEKVLRRYGLADTVQVIGGTRIADGFVVTAEVKKALTAELRNTKGYKVWAFGDGPVDLGMLGEADEGIVVVGEEENRSKSMEGELRMKMNNGLKVRQVLLPGTKTIKPRLNTTKLPLVKLNDPELIEAIFGQVTKVFTAAGTEAGKLLMTPMRNAKIAGVALRESHRRIGWYLAHQFVSQIIGLEEFDIEHVQGHTVTGYSLLNERSTTIIASMRGGEPMALGVSDAFPLANFLHVKVPDDIQPKRLKGQSSVILVDSIINTGKSMVELIERVRELNADIPIVMVAGVVSEKAMAGNSLLPVLGRKEHFTLVTLRFSDSHFVGKGHTDTGHRLFNTTFMP